MKNYISVTLAVVSLLIAGCKGSKGGQGSTGAQGPAGAPGGLPEGVVYSGTATSDPYIVPIPNLDVSKDDLVMVYVCNSANTQCVQPNLYISTLPGNLSYIETPGAIQLDNVIADHMPNYFITVISKH